MTHARQIAVLEGDRPEMLDMTTRPKFQAPRHQTRSATG
jgi:hypothetical protein